MSCRSELQSILADEGLTRGLQDPEARILIEWLVEEVQRLDQGEPLGEILQQQVQRLRRRARSIRSFVQLWCHAAAHAAACQLAATERFPWPLPPVDADPCDLMAHILSWEATTL